MYLFIKTRRLRPEQAPLRGQSASHQTEPQQTGGESTVLLKTYVWYQLAMFNVRVRERAQVSVVDLRWYSQDLRASMEAPRLEMSMEPGWP